MEEVNKKVRCKDTGKLMPLNQVYTVTKLQADKGMRTLQTQYWSSKKAYDEFNNNKTIQYRYKIINFMYDLLNLDPNVTDLSPGFYESLNAYNPESYPFVYEVLQESRMALEKVLDTKVFYSEYGKMKYLMAIVQNKLFKYKDIGEDIMKNVVKCKDTGAQIDKTLAYKHTITSGKTVKNEYWSSEAAFLKHEEEVNDRKACVSVMFQILGYDENKDQINTCFFKFLEEYKDMGFDVILETINGERERMEWAVSHKEFSSEYGKIRYLMAIIQNNLMTYKKNHKDKESKQKFIESDFVPVDIAAGIDIASVGRTVKKNNNVVNNILGDI